ncbi:MAG TPA: hypothetical protein VGL46_12675 [Pseudonocardiaceae bacterium]
MTGVFGGGRAFRSAGVLAQQPGQPRETLVPRSGSTVVVNEAGIVSGRPATSSYLPDGVYAGHVVGSGPTVGARRVPALPLR